MACDAQTLINAAVANGYDKLSDRDLKEALVAAACAGGGGGSGATGAGVLYGSGSPEGVVTAPVGWIYQDITNGVLIAQYTKLSGSGNTGWG